LVKYGGGMSRRLTPRGEQRRSELLAFATKRFAANGYHPTSVAELVDGLGVGKGVFYWYFESKEELFAEILRTAQNDMRRTQQRRIEGVEDPVERIQLGVRAAVLWMSEHDDLRRLFEFARTEAAFNGAMKAGQRVVVNDAVAHLKEAIVLGRIPDRDPEVLAHAILGVANHLTRVFIGSRGQDPEEVADMVVTFCMEGIGATR
jgi:AcrR family transcriptional regulator